MEIGKIKWEKLLMAAITVVFLVACKNGSSSAKAPEQTPAAKYTIVPGVTTGWDIYTGGVYRYGPSIILNSDGSIDAWFAAPGDAFGDKVKNFNEQDPQVAINLATALSAAQRFSAAEPFYAIQVACPNWNTTNSSLTLSFYKWKSDYNTTVASPAISTVFFINYKDNQGLSITNENKFSAGEYLWVLSNPVGTAGVWKKTGIKSGVTNYLNGEIVTGNYNSWMLLNKSGGGAYWDQVAYRRSLDNGVTWTEDQMVLKPTEYSRDQLSVCDPGVAKWGGFYYLGYTSTEDSRGTNNHVYVCRSASPAGPWEKWNGTGWGGDPQPVITYTESPDFFGAGEPSMVVKNDTLFLYYSWNANGLNSTTTRLATVSAKEANWPLNLKDRGTVINKSGITAADHCDVKYRDDLKKFQAIHTASRMTSASYLVLWESADGINFTKIAEIRDKLNPFLHNCGWSGDETGHINPEKQQYISYSYGSAWANWKTAWHPLNFKL
jgi:hypothetical protein